MTLKLTIDNIVFYLEQEAFELMHNYLEYLILTNTSKRLEVREAQIAEYFLSRLSNGNQVTTTSQVRHIIKKLEAEPRITTSRGSHLSSAKLLVGKYLGQLEWGVN